MTPPTSDHHDHHEDLHQLVGRLTLEQARRLHQLVDDAELSRVAGWKPAATPAQDWVAEDVPMSTESSAAVVGAVHDWDTGLGKSGSGQPFEVLLRRAATAVRISTGTIFPGRK